MTDRQKERGRSEISAVYTGIKKPESFSHSSFSLKVARQLPLNTPKKTESKNPPLQRDFFETLPKFHWFFANVNARSNLAGIIWVFGHVVRDLQRNHPTAARDVMRTTRVRSKVERSRACAPLTKTQVWDSGFFAHALFVPKTPNVMGFSGSVNGTTKNPGSLDFGFCQCKWAYRWFLHWYVEYDLGLIFFMIFFLFLVSCYSSINGSHKVIQNPKTLDPRSRPCIKLVLKPVGE